MTIWQSSTLPKKGACVETAGAAAKSEMVERFWSKVSIGDPDSCWLWLANSQPNRNGTNNYGTFRLGRMRKAHQVAWEIANRQSVPLGLVVRHSCDVSLCCNPRHLVLGSQKENVADRYVRGRARHSVGSAHGFSKLTEADIPLIRQMLKDGIPQREIGRRFGVSQYPIKELAAGRGWTHV